MVWYGMWYWYGTLPFSLDIVWSATATASSLSLSMVEFLVSMDSW
jgi:hypothetical protein